MSILKKNKGVVIFYLAILGFAMIWMWRVEKLEESTIDHGEIVMLDLQY